MSFVFGFADPEFRPVPPVLDDPVATRYVIQRNFDDITDYLLQLSKAVAEGGGGGGTGGPPSGPAGGVLSGTYPNPGFAQDMATQTELNNVAATIPTTPGPPNGPAGGVLSGTYPNPGFAVDMATQAELDAAIAGIPAGPQGPPGPTGATGAQGPAGPGVPVGGTANQVLAKINSTDYNTQWVTPSASGATGPAGGVLSGTYPNPGFAVDMATQAELDAVMARGPAGGVLAGTYPNPTFAQDMATQAELDAAIAGVSSGSAASSGSFGDGSDGTRTFDGTTTILGMAPSGNIYTLTRDLYLDSCTINNGVQIKTNGYRFFVKNTLTNNGTIQWNGASGNGSAAGSATSFGSASINTGQVGSGGSTGQAGSSSGNVGAQSASLGGAGGKGGVGSGGFASGTAGTVTAVAATSSLPRTLQFAIMAMGFAGGTGSGALPGWFGGAGGSGGTGSASNSGGGGGAGGGCVLVVARTIVGTGFITARGGNGGNAPGANAGGGGAGGGGWVAVVSGSVVGGAVAGQTIDANAGTAGASTGTGGAATPASNGSVFLIQEGRAGAGAFDDSPYALVSGARAITGYQYFNAGINVTLNAMFNNDLGVNGNTSMQGTLSVIGNSVFSGQVRGQNDDNYFGKNANGQAGTAVHIGSLGDANNAYVESVGSGAVVPLILRSKGAGSNIQFQPGAAGLVGRVTEPGILEVGTKTPGTTLESNRVGATAQMYGRGFAYAADGGDFANNIGTPSAGFAISVGRSDPAALIKNSGSGPILILGNGSASRLYVANEGSGHWAGNDIRLGKFGNTDNGSRWDIYTGDPAVIYMNAESSGADTHMYFNAKGTGSFAFYQGSEVFRIGGGNGVGNVSLGAGGTGGKIYFMNLNSVWSGSAAAGGIFTLPATARGFITVYVDQVGDVKIPVFLP